MAKLVAKPTQKASLKSSGFYKPAGEIEIEENGTYNVKSFSSANVNVPQPVLIEKSISENGIYQASQDDAGGYSKVSVNVQPSLTTKAISANGTYQASQDDADGYREVVVDVPPIIPVDEESVQPFFLGIGENGFYFTNDQSAETPVFFGLDSNGHPYATNGGNMNE